MPKLKKVKMKDTKAMADMLKAIRVRTPKVMKKVGERDYDKEAEKSRKEYLSEVIRRKKKFYRKGDTPGARKLRKALGDLPDRLANTAAALAKTGKM